MMVLQLILLILALASSGSSKSVVQITDDNWEQVLHGEWIIKFFAPWCPACRAMTETWNNLGRSYNDHNDYDHDGPHSTTTTVAEVDVTKSPGLSGRFLIGSLPTVYHAKDGEFRLYRGRMTMERLADFLESASWRQEEPLPFWKHPSSIQMSVMSYFFKVSMMLRNVHSTLTEQYELPSWSVYLIFTLSTILVGVLLGLVLVFCIDCLLPMLTSGGIRRSDLNPTRSSPKAAKKDKDSEDEEGDIPDRDSDADVDADADVGGSGDHQLRKRPRKPGKI